MSSRLPVQRSFGMLLLAAAVPVVNGATLQVNTTADIANSVNGCSLRTAAKAVNEGNDIGGCKNINGEPYGTNDTILVAPGNYPMQLGMEIDLHRSMRIQGQGAASMDLLSKSRAFNISISGDNPIPFTVTIDNLDIYNGYSGSNGGNHGGAISNYGTSLVYSNGTIKDCVSSAMEAAPAMGSGPAFAGNAGRGGAIFSHGKLKIVKAYFIGNTARSVAGTPNDKNAISSISSGGAIHAEKSIWAGPIGVEISDSIFKGNKAASGGALYINDDFIIQDSEIDRNTALGGSGGGLFVGELAGAANIDQRSTISATNIRENQAIPLKAEPSYINGIGGGLVNSGLELVISQSSITDNYDFPGTSFFDKYPIGLLPSNVSAGGIFNNDDELRYSYHQDDAVAEGGFVWLTNSTVSGNFTALDKPFTSGAQIRNEGMMLFEHSTIFDDSPSPFLLYGIDNLGELYSKASIVAAECSAAAMSSGYNVEISSSCGLSDATDLQNAVVNNVILPLESNALFFPCRPSSGAEESRHRQVAGLPSVRRDCDSGGRARPVSTLRWRWGRQRPVR